MTFDEKVTRFREWTKRLRAYEMALTMIGLDQGQVPPSQGEAFRSENRAVLGGEYRRVLQDGEMLEIIEALHEELKDDTDLSREVSLYHHRLTKEKDIPAEVFIEYQKVLEASKHQWLICKAEKDYRAFAPYLKALVESYEDLMSRKDSPLSLYDRMLDERQPGWTMERYDSFFSQVRERIVPLLARIQEKEPVEEGFLHLSYPAERQRRTMPHVLELMRFTPDWGRIAESEHPLTTTVSAGDVRFTTKYREHDLAQAVLSSVHETGHAWFGHGVDPAYDGTIIAKSISAGLHESQSRLLENHIGRSLPFWEEIFPFYQKEFPEELNGVSAYDFYLAVNSVKRSLVRTEADEVTYPLHIMIRYELEKAIFIDHLPVSELEEAWNEKYREYLGVCPSNAAEGILQDMHWPYAYFGYFPTYALGSALAAQVFAHASRDLDIPGLIHGHRLDVLQDYLKAKIHHLAGRCEMDEVIRRATGEEFDPNYYLTYLETKYTDLYHL